ncbi:MAG TPA: hypothetical protein VGD37_05230 [Kofleriaceae bacterium]
MTASNTSITVAPSGAGAWSLETERRVGEHAARGTAIVLAAAKPDPAAAPHAELAGARAWAALGAQRLSAGDAADAVTAARAGLEELGDDYRPRGVKDDTMMKIDAAEERITEGAVADGAAVLLRMLETRIELYVQNHGPDVR